MTGVTGPEEYANGLGEVIRAHRMYIGLSRAAMAKELEMAFRTYERIEDGTRICPPGLLDSLRNVVVRFDDAVEQFIAQSEATDARVFRGEDFEWHRAVVGRASLAIPFVPELVG